MYEELLNTVKFNEQGLVVAIAQDFQNHEILMVAYMNRETLSKTLQTGQMTYWSRSRQKEWIKGETSGHFQEVKEVRIDCDGDALVFKIEQTEAACHTGYRSCFYRVFKNNQLKVDGEKVVD